LRGGNRGASAEEGVSDLFHLDLLWLEVLSHRLMHLLAV
jgi:hypothetical protein